MLRSDVRRILSFLTALPLSFIGLIIGVTIGGLMGKDMVKEYQVYMCLGGALGGGYFFWQAGWLLWGLLIPFTKEEIAGGK